MVKILDVKQGSAEWHDLRKIKLGASCAPIIMGVSTYKTPFELYQEMKGNVEPEKQNWAMERGKELEKEAVQIYESTEQIKTFDPVGEADIYVCLIASMDAVCVNDYKKCAEVKAIDIESHYATYRGDVPDIYYPQLQHQMYVWELDQIDYISYHPEAFIEYTKTVVKRDEKYLQQYIPKALAFMDCIYSNTAPEKTEKDWIDCSSDIDYEKLQLDYMHANNQFQCAEKEKEKCRKALIDYCRGRKVYGEYLKINKYTTQGKVQYNKIPELQYINLDKFRGPSIESYRIDRVR